MGGERGTRSVVDRSGSFTNRRDLFVRSIQHLKYRSILLLLGIRSRRLFPSHSFGQGPSTATKTLQLGRVGEVGWVGGKDGGRVSEVQY